MGLAETQLKMAECIPSPGRTNGTVVWVQRSWPSERTLREGGGGVGRPDRDRRGHWGRVAGLHGSHHPHQFQQTASNCSQRVKFVEGKRNGSCNLNLKKLMHYLWSDIISINLGIHHRNDRGTNMMRSVMTCCCLQAFKL